MYSSQWIAAQTSVQVDDCEVFSSAGLRTADLGQYSRLNLPPIYIDQLFSTLHKALKYQKNQGHQQEPKKGIDHHIDLHNA